MRRNIQFIIFTLTLIFVVFTGYSRNIAFKQFALFEYQVIIDKNFRAEIKDLDELINSIRSYTDKKQDKLEGKIYDIAYPYIEEKLETKYQIDILPINTFTDNINYNAYNYPATNIKKAQDLGNSNYYLKIIILIETNTPNTKEAKNSVLYKNKTTPQVNVTIEIYDKIGMLAIGKAVGEAKASVPQRIDDFFLKGIIKPVKEEEIKSLDENLLFLLHEAITKAVDEFDKQI